MLISDSHRFAFIHIRKSAGSSVRNALKPYAIEKPTDLLSKLKSKTRIENNYQHFYFQLHSDVMLLKSVMPKEVFNSYFKFAYVRSPWTRLLSEYLYIQRKPNHGRHKKVSKMSFDDYIIYQAKRFDAHQANMLCDRTGKVQIDFVAKFENLHEDWQTICQHIGIHKVELPHLNKNKEQNNNHYFNKKNIQLIEKLWERDIETFNYHFDLDGDF